MTGRSVCVGISGLAAALVAALPLLMGDAATPGVAARGRKPDARLRGCGAADMGEREIDVVERLTDRALKNRGQLLPASMLGTIPVAVHVIYYNNGSQNVGLVSMGRIDEQIAVLNEAFANLSFELASVDFTNNEAWFNMAPNSAEELAAKTSLQADPSRFLNLYTAGDAGVGLLGWATFPWNLSRAPELDGVVVYHGSLPGGEAPYDEGDTAVHEVGHWLGLYHTFQGGCSLLNDRVQDTPAQWIPTYGCPRVKNSCPQRGLDPIHNYMDYSDDACLFEFTSGQYNRMARMVNAYRQSLFD